MGMREKGGFLDLAEMVNAGIKTFCLENGLYLKSQTTETFNGCKMAGLGHSAGITVSLTFSAYLEDEPYRSALGYGSDTATGSS
jgi:hypothetical protein